MTTLALIAGMTPVALGYGEGADFRAPLGRAVIGGTITSTLLTLLVIPTVYETLYGWRERLTARFRHRVTPHEPACAPPPRSFAALRMTMRAIRESPRVPLAEAAGLRW
jgi:HAE1 family hydrophobic/amphiphilic exporter-1